MTATEARQVLGLQVPFSEADLRDAYHRKAKESHPDVASASPMAHIEMTELTQAYNLLRSQLGSSLAGPLTDRRRNEDYDLYKRGTAIVEKIHPSEWIRVTKKGLFNPSAIEEKSNSSEAFNTAIVRIEEAYQIFTELIERFPDSLWALDSHDRLKLLDRMAVRYKQMVENST